MSDTHGVGEEHFVFCSVLEEVKDLLLAEIEKIKKVAYNDFKLDLVRKIIALKDCADKMTKKEKINLIIIQIHQ